MRRKRLIAAALGPMLASTAFADNDHVFITGRRDPRIYAIDLKAALRSENNGTDKAVISRSLVNPTRLDGALLGDPATFKLSADQRTAFVMNHHGAVVCRIPAARRPRQHRRPRRGQDAQTATRQHRGSAEGELRSRLVVSGVRSRWR